MMPRLRPIYREEFDRVNAFCSTAFRGQVDNRFPNDLPPGSCYPLHQVVEDEAGEIVAHGFFHPKPVWVHGCLTMVGDVGNVCTHPERRKLGYSRVLMEGLVGVMQAARMPLSLLGGSPTLYAKFGWAGTGGTVEIDVSGTASVPAVATTPIVSGDMPWIMRCYAEVWQGRTGMVQRDKARWTNWRTQIEHDSTFTLPHGAGYACASLPNGHQGLLREITARDSAAYFALFDAIWQEAQARGVPAVELHAHRDGPEHRAFARWATERKLVVAREDFYTGSMWRIVDVGRLLQDLTPFLLPRLDRPLSLTIATEDGETAFHLGPWGVCLAAHTDHRLELPIGKLAEWWLGPARIAELLEQGIARLHGDLDPAHLARLFPPAAIYTALPDRE